MHIRLCSSVLYSLFYIMSKNFALGSLYLISYDSRLLVILFKYRLKLVE
jgi:hypothetical protein